MSSVLTHAIITNSIEAVDSYIATAKGLRDELDGVISVLTSTNFTGDASNGYSAFYANKVIPAIADNLTDGANSLTAGIKNLLEGIQEQLLDTVDPQLGDNNQNQGSGE